MKMKKIILFAFVMLMHFTIKTQTLQTYNGVFENGKAVYQYYENEKADRIYEGTFNYTSKIYTILGSFKADKREGTWKISALNKVHSTEIGKIQLNTLITGKYLVGNMDGLWSYSNATKTFNKKTKKFNPKAEKVVASANFKDNHFIGKFSYDRTYLTKTKTTGQFDENGFADGIWLTTYPKTIEELKFNKGVLYSKLVKDITTGEKIIYYDSLTFHEDFWKAYDSEKKLAIIEGKMYLLDTVEVINPALSVWQSDLYLVETFGNIINPLYYYAKRKSIPHAYQLKIIACDNNADCYSNYLKQKNEEIARAAKEEQLQAEKSRLEALEKEELARIEKEKEELRMKQENVLNFIQLARKLSSEKKHKEAITYYTKANELMYSDEVTRLIIEEQNKIEKISSLHISKNQLNNELKARSEQAFSRTSSLELPLKNRKKVYAKNYIMCVDYLKLNFNKAIEPLQNESENLDYWTEQDERNFIILKEIEVQLKEIEDFQNSVFDAVSNNNKAKLRVLNSSINPKMIINDMINFKMVN
jgi:ssDNA-binding Zn-finger/Zn-ribbon topoisomerase 1